MISLFIINIWELDIRHLMTLTLTCQVLNFGEPPTLSLTIPHPTTPILTSLELRLDSEEAMEDTVSEAMGAMEGMEAMEDTEGMEDSEDTEAIIDLCIAHYCLFCC